MTERLRFTGTQTLNFQTGNVGNIEPEGEFDVSDELAPRFLARADVEYADGRPKRGSKRRQPKLAPDAGGETSADTTGDPEPSRDPDSDAGDPNPDA